MKKNAKDVLARRLNELMESRPDLNSQVKLSQKMGTGQTNIGRIRRGEVNATAEIVQKIADAFGVTVGDLYDDTERPIARSLRRPASVLEEGPALRPSRNIPIVGVAIGGPQGHLNIDSYAVGQGEGYVSFPSSDPGAYVLKVRGDSMRPRIKSGEFIVVEPNAEAQQGDEVVVKLRDDGVIVKELLWIRDGEMSLGSINDSVPPMTVPLSSIQYVHRVAAIVPRGSPFLLPGH